MKERGLWERLVLEADLQEEVLPGQPVVELIGERRVLIEGHCGVKEYSRERISIGVRFGMIQICGRCLELSRMTKEQLVICGRIDCVTLKRRDYR